MGIKPKPSLQKLTGKVIDLKRASEYLSKPDTSYALNLLKMLIDSFPNEIKTLETARRKGDWGNVIETAHKLRGSSVYAGTYRLHAACANLEDAYGGKVEELYEKLFQAILTEMDKVEQAYQKLA